jgi:hypothetical protein
MRQASVAILLLAVPALVFAADSTCGPDLSGCWTGCWQDDCSGHHGPLRATFCKCDDTHYQVTFSGRFFKVLPFRYTVVLTVTKQAADKVWLEGESDLGRLFGTFTYRAEATCTHFVADYSSCRYQGRFILNRGCH